MLRKVLIFIGFLTLPLIAQAQTKWTGIEVSDDRAAGMLAAAETVVQLVRSERMVKVNDEGDEWETNSDLRVSLVVIDLGPATDVSPKIGVHLAMFNELNECCTAWALVPIVDGYAFHGAKRTAAGVYEVEVTVLNYGSECDFERRRFTVDARQLSVNVRQAKGVGFLGDKRFSGNYTITDSFVACGSY